MAKKRRNDRPAAHVQTPAEAASKPPSAAELSRRGGRETADALIVAIVLAFLIKTFMAEMFVIPTGSMAPTLMGRHKDAFCEQSGVRFKVNSADERTAYAQQLQARAARTRTPISRADLERRLPEKDCVAGQSPQSRYINPLASNLPASWTPGSDAPQPADYGGDRLVVSKYSYSFRDPERWDVAVFKYPGDSQTNYIKRITGLPGEDLQIFQGDIYARPLGSDEPFAIERKPAKIAMVMRQFVHDTEHEASRLIDAGWPLAWSGEDLWKVEVESGKRNALLATYQAKAPADSTAWLRYRHTPPTENVWTRVFAEKGEIDFDPPPELITDFTPYNTRLNLDHAAFNVERTGGLSLAPTSSPDLGRLGLHWVSDLMLEADVRVEGDQPRVSLDLVKAGDHFGVTIDGDSGEAKLWRRPFESGDEEILAKVSTSFRSRKNHSIRLANFDHQLLLWIDGSLIEADATFDTIDQGGDALIPRTSETDEGDLAPAGVAVSGGSIEVDRLQLWRDGYYLATNARLNSDPSGFGFTTDLTPKAFENGDHRRLQELPAAPELWYALANRRRVAFPVGEDQLFVMGDNSGWSLDARLWSGGNGRDGGRPGGAYLEKSQLVGKAVCVYWPHSWYRLPVNRNLQIPLWPNFGDMRLVR